MSSGSKTKTVVKSEEGPWKPSVPYLTNIMGQAQSAYNSGQDDTYAPFSTVVPFSNQSEDALGMFEDRARNGSPLLSTANQQVSGMMNGVFDDSPAFNYLTGVAQGNNLNGNPWLDSMFDRASEKVTNRVNQSAGLKGRAGSGAHQQLLQSQLGDLANSVYAQNYQQERNHQVDAISKLQAAWEDDNARRINAVGAAQTLADAPYMDAQILREVGTHRETMAQSQLADLQARHGFDQTNPWNQLNQYNALMSGMGNQGRTLDSTNTQTVKRTASPLDMFGDLVGTLLMPAPSVSTVYSKIFGG